RPAPGRRPSRPTSSCAPPPPCVHRSASLCGPGAEWGTRQGRNAVVDLVIRNGLVVDGTGAAPAVGDVAVDDGRIVAVGTVDERGTREIDAAGLVVAPGWVDVHTHYDGQATWDTELTPSAWHGVTTAVFGNCSVGFAPVRPGTESFLINLMEGVEDIPGTVLAEGIDFRWESFGEY